MHGCVLCRAQAVPCRSWSKSSTWRQPELACSPARLQGMLLPRIFWESRGARSPHPHNELLSCSQAAALALPFLPALLAPLIPCSHEELCCVRAVTAGLQQRQREGFSQSLLPLPGHHPSTGLVPVSYICIWTTSSLTALTHSWD